MPREVKRFYETMEHTRTALFRCIQRENLCHTTGVPCTRVCHCESYTDAAIEYERVQQS